MEVKEAYGMWSGIYDSNTNKTRDLEKSALIACLKEFRFGACLEIGCGTGKNTEWLAANGDQVTAVDLTEEMLAIAREKITFVNVRFVQADITQSWAFAQKQYDLITFSLVLEHIEGLDPVFKNAAQHLKSGGIIYIGELHPFKQYAGTKAKFETDGGTITLPCYTHNVSDFVRSAKKHGLDIFDVNEFFDDGDTTHIPRILTLLFRKQ